MRWGGGWAGEGRTNGWAGDSPRYTGCDETSHATPARHRMGWGQLRKRHVERGKPREQAHATRATPAWKKTRGQPFGQPLAKRATKFDDLFA